jgi:hypothetical protein
MDPESVKQAVARALADLEAGRPLKRPAFAFPAVALAAMGIAIWPGCDAVDLYGAPPDDTQAVDTATPEYGAPIEDCTNEIDDDLDGLVDCDDDDCDGDPACDAGLYRAP